MAKKSATKPSTADVEFQLGGRTYAYLTKIEIKVGDLVIVPVGTSGEKTVSVVHVPSLNPKFANKYVIRKAE